MASLRQRSLGRNRSAGGGGESEAALECSAESVHALYDLVDEAHHAGSFARIFPPAGARGCGRYCHFLGEHVAPEDRLLWTFLRTHGALMPRRARLPPPRARRSP